MHTPDLASTGLAAHDDAAVGRGVLEAEQAGLAALAAGLGEPFAAAVAALSGIAGRVVVTGMGKSGHVGRKIAATLASTGTPALFVHPAEASHGDLGMVLPGDAVLALSNSGETAELADIVAHARRFGLVLVGVTGNSASALASACDHVLLLPEAPEACPMGLAPTTSTTMQMALGDALAVALLRRRGFSANAFREFHPGGRLGARLRHVRDVMHSGAALPLAGPGSGDASRVADHDRQRVRVPGRGGRRAAGGDRDRWRLAPAHGAGPAGQERGQRDDARSAVDRAGCAGGRSAAPDERPAAADHHAVRGGRRGCCHRPAARA